MQLCSETRARATLYQFFWAKQRKIDMAWLWCKFCYRVARVTRGSRITLHHAADCGSLRWMFATILISILRIFQGGRKPFVNRIGEWKVAVAKFVDWDVEEPASSQKTNLEISTSRDRASDWDVDVSKFVHWG